MYVVNDSYVAHALPACETQASSCAADISAADTKLLLVGDISAPTAVSHHGPYILIIDLSSAGSKIIQCCPLLKGKRVHVSGVNSSASCALVPLAVCMLLPLMREADSNHWRILVHCNDGLRTSCTVEVLFLTIVKGMNFEDALMWTRAQRGEQALSVDAHMYMQLVRYLSLPADARERVVNHHGSTVVPWHIPSEPDSYLNVPLLQWRVKVQWDNGSWYAGTITSYYSTAREVDEALSIGSLLLGDHGSSEWHSVKGKIPIESEPWHVVAYDDGDTESLQLLNEAVDFITVTGKVNNTQEYQPQHLLQRHCCCNKHCIAEYCTQSR